MTKKTPDLRLLGKPQKADPETVAEIHAARCTECKGAGCLACGFKGTEAVRALRELRLKLRRELSAHPDTLHGNILSIDDVKDGLRIALPHPDGTSRSYVITITAENEDS